jgi:hypothetical protein
MLCEILSKSADKRPDVEAIREQWLAAWPHALELWSKFTQLSAPHWCVTIDDEKREQLAGSFAMIRFVDHAVVISLRQVRERRLERFATEILAHEIGHHVYCPADLNDNARLLARITKGLPSKEQAAPMISNLYTDLLINDRLQRESALDMAGVYRALENTSQDRLWTLYMRIYEVLWSLERGSLAKGVIDERLNMDAVLGARLIRSYHREWLDGGGRFACLCLTYLIEDGKNAEKNFEIWGDTRAAGAGGLPDGMVEADDDETTGAIHPSEDPALSGYEPDLEKEKKPGGDGDFEKQTPAQQTGIKQLKKFRSPFEYTSVLKAAGATLTDAQLVARYYRILALPHLVKFPSRDHPVVSDPHPEGLDVWDIGSSLTDIDWLATLTASPQVVPGMTTRRRLMGDMPGTTPEKKAIDLYLGVDCSGSMSNPASRMSYPILAGAIIALSALRAGSRVMVALSGEPGKTITTDGFLRDESLILTTLTDYLGTGTTFGIHRLADTFDHRPANSPQVHILIVTDNDIFGMLDAKQKPGLGWEIADRALASAKGGGTYVLQLPNYLMNNAAARAAIHPGCQKMIEHGWNVANIDSMDELVLFAKRFSEKAYGEEKRSTKR